MALTRSMLKGMGLTDEQVGAIIEEHVSVTNALKDQVDSYKEDAEKLPSVQQELDNLKKEVKEGDWQKKYEKEHKDFEDYKADVQAKETSSKVHTAYKKLLIECGVGEKYVDSIIRVTDFADMELKDDGNLENVDALKKGITDAWSGFIPTQETRGVGNETPPTGGTPDEGNAGRAAKLAAKYHENLYGKKEEA